MGEFFAKQIPNARLETIENCGHMLPFEKPDEFVAKTVEFVKG
jgi:pimeloyl-ACP methyl ester carboxylesterase